MPHFYFRKTARASGAWHTKKLSSFRRGKQRPWFWLALTFFLAVAIVSVGALAWLTRGLPSPEGIVQRTVAQSTKIYDRTGKVLLYDLHGEERRTAIPFSDMPQHLKWAVLTSEDRSFYEHGGFKLTSLIRAIVIDVLRGGRVQGGSTITQQFIKNAIFSNEKLFTRKIKELVLAYRIEKQFTKDEILKLYLNEIPFGGNAYGVEAAAQSYFGKPAKEISLAQSAMLAAIIKAPSYYSPWGTHRDELNDRQHYILDTMVELGYINQGQADAAKAEKLALIARREQITAPHFVFYVKEQLAAKYGERMVEQGGLTIVTSLDAKLQKYAEEAVAGQAKANEKYNAGNASLVAIDVATGQVVAMVGSKDFFDDSIKGQVNVAVKPRQPGSSFKPVVYGAALALGFTPNTKLFDVVTTFKTYSKDYTPHNYDNKERGPVTLRQALAGSLNIPAVEILYLTGISHVLDQAQKLGYTTLNDRSRFGLSLVLGGAEVKLIEHTNTFAAFAREGVAKPFATILKVTAPDGTVLEEHKDTAGSQVLPAQNVRELTSILSDNEARAYIFGAKNKLTLPDRPVAAKTGTTNDYHDAWTMGYTPDLATGVWVGNSDNKEMKRGADGSVVAAPIWQAFMTKATQNTPVHAFTPPEPRLTGKSVLDGGLGGEQVVIDIASGKRANDLTPTSYRLTREYGQYHTILHYITPGDPLGATPSDPSQDPQYASWETSVQTWAEAHGYVNAQTPTEYDDVHTLANRPSVSITSPSENGTVTNNPIGFSVNAQASRGVKRVEYWLDNQLIGTASSYPFSLNFTVTTDWPNGYHTIRAVAYDDVDNAGEANLTFNLLTTAVPSIGNVKFKNLKNNQTISLGSAPITLYLTATLNELRQIDVYAQPESGLSQWLGVALPVQASNTFTWTPGAPGTYTISATLTNTNGSVSQGPKVTVQIEP